MRNFDLIQLILAIMLFLCFILLLSYFIYSRYNKLLAKVLKLSMKIRKIEELNKQSKFRSFQSSYTYSLICNSKAQFDRVSLFSVLQNRVKEDEQHFRKLIPLVVLNQKRYSQYSSKFEKILSFEDSEQLFTQFKYFRLIEQRECNARRIRPAIDIDFKIECLYCSPKGQNYYRNEETFHLNDIERALKGIENQRTTAITREHERSMMTNSLRYDIMKRDNFTCVLCGRSAMDGVKLHIDHIKPIAKDGKTEPANLRTLCDICNSGKSDKFDTDGKN